MIQWNESPLGPGRSTNLRETGGPFHSYIRLFVDTVRTFRNGSNFAGFTGLRSVLKTRPAWVELDGRFGVFSWLRRFGVSAERYIYWRQWFGEKKWGNYCNITLSPFVSLLPWNLGKKHSIWNTEEFPLVSWQREKEKNTWNAPSRMLTRF